MSASVIRQATGVRAQGCASPGLLTTN